VTFTPAEIAAWQREVDHWSVALDAAWDDLAATPRRAGWSRAYATIEAATVAIRSLLDMRDDVQERASSSEKLT
jgi:hypothetical protein